jgi:hypothetical protein
MGLDKNSVPDAPVMFYNIGIWRSSEAPGMVLFRPFMHEPPNGIDLVNESALEPLNLYPNPASERIWIEIPFASEGKDIPVFIYDTSGRQLHHSILRSNSLDVSQYTPGLYYIRILIDGEPYYSKVLINR